MAKKIVRKKSDATRSAGISSRLLIVAILVGIVAIATSSYAILTPRTVIVYVNSTTTTTTIPPVLGYNITSSFPQVEMTLAGAPVITQNQSFGSRLTGLNAPLNASELSTINNAPESYFETAGGMYLNDSLANIIGKWMVDSKGVSYFNPRNLSLFIVNGKPSVIYFGSTTCVYCAENKWAMALALSRFGSFAPIFKGYSALGDGDVPTLLWAPAHYNTSSTEAGAFYTSNYINFIAIEDNNKITGGFNLNPTNTIQSRLNATGSIAYADALKYIGSTSDFRGTPFTVWGAYEVNMVDGVIFGNSTPTSSNFTITYMTHEQLLKNLAMPNSQMAWSEYAAADVYVALTCKTIKDAAPVCKLPAIQKIEVQLGI